MHHRTLILNADVTNRTALYNLKYKYLDLNSSELLYAPPWGLSTRAKQFSAAARIMQSSSKELSTLVADWV